MSIVDILAGGVKGKPHSTKEGRKSTAKRKVKSWNKKLNKFAKDYHLGRPFMKLKKPEKKKDYVVDPNATVGGTRIKKQGPQPGPEDQEKHWENYPQRKLAGGGKATHGYGKAYMKGGKV